MLCCIFLFSFFLLLEEEDIEEEERGGGGGGGGRINLALLFDSRVEEIERSVGLVLQFTTIIIIITPDFVIVLP